ncbi:MAG: leucine-rich repeat protein, partial [Verrucomicrobia bacterium]|nr:leucine-rich repeat protein [Verrucomicrobiota bacterium]
PVVRLSLGHSASESLLAYSQANEFNRTLTNKMSAAPLAKFKQSVLIRHLGNCTQLTAALSKLPSPAVLHFTQYLHGGFDKEYPDHLPPSADFGTESEFKAFLTQTRERGLLTMPYVNPTFWGDNPRGPTFQTNGTAPLLLNLDASFSYEDYFGNGGYTVTPWHPAVQAANRSTVSQFVTNYPVDMLFEDQIGARTWQYDMNTASPTPYAYASGIAAIAAEDSQSIPVSTENGWDRLVNFNSQFCGMAWGLVPTTNAPVWRRFLRERYAPGTWKVFPLAQYIAHDKLAMNYNDLSAPVTTDEVVAWTLALGYGMTYYLEATDLDQDATRQWLLWVDRLQKSVCARYIGEPVNSFSHQWGTNAVNPDNGLIQSSYGLVSIVSNLGPQSLTNNGHTIAPYGFIASSSGMVASKLIPPGASNAVWHVAETNTSGGIDFWIYSKGNQTADISLPSGFNGPVTVQMDGSSSGQTQIQSNALTVSLGSAASPTTSYLWHGSVLPSFSCTTNSNNTITITGYTGPSGAATIPGTIAGLPVTSIGDYAFNGNTGLTSMTISSSVNTIGSYAFFGCSSLTNVTIGSGVTSIGNAAFQGCSGLTSVTIPNSVTSMGNNAFYSCSGLTNVTIGSGITAIGTSVFQGCSALTSVTIPNNVTAVGNYAFYGCSGLTNVTFGNGLISIGDGAFQACSVLTSVKIPKSVTSIGIWAFGSCSGLTNVYLLGNAPGADSSVFANDSNLTVYYLLGTTGWTNPWNNLPIVCWNPTTRNLGFDGSQFGFDITGPNNLTVVVEACSDLSKNEWVSLGPVTLSAEGTGTFRDPEAYNNRTRFYRLSAP